MLNKETYERELIRMWDSIRETNKGSNFCYGLSCSECPLDKVDSCDCPINAVAMTEIVEKWAKEHPPKHKVSQTEFEILRSLYKSSNLVQFVDFRFLLDMIEKGYFEGADENMKICDYLNDCEVCEVIEGDTDKR